VASYSLQRGLGVRRAALIEAFVADPDDRSYAERLKATVARLEGKLRAIERIPSLDQAALRAATTHTRFVCGYEGYELAEVDDPPPGIGEVVEQDGTSYTVWRLTPSPLPDDARRCAVLILDR
jgi:hypothetical protein